MSRLKPTLDVCGFSFFLRVLLNCAPSAISPLACSLVISLVHAEYTRAHCSGESRCPQWYKLPSQYTCVCHLPLPALWTPAKPDAERVDLVSSRTSLRPSSMSSMRTCLKSFTTSSPAPCLAASSSGRMRLGGRSTTFGPPSPGFSASLVSCAATATQRAAASIDEK